MVARVRNNFLFGVRKYGRRTGRICDKTKLENCEFGGKTDRTLFNFGRELELRHSLHKTMHRLQPAKLWPGSWIRGRQTKRLESER